MSMHLVAYMKTGPTSLHSGGWRHPEATLQDIFDPRRYEQAATLFESARLDGCFFADAFGFPDTYKGLEVFAESGGQNSYLDPVTVIPLMARVTRNLGLGVTISTSFHSAYHLARTLASLDILSGGRVAWNLVTSTTTFEAANAGIELPPHDERYDRADEVIEACTALWQTWDDDPFLLDKKAGRFADGTKVHYADYEGRWTRTRGPLTTPRSPQGHPVVMQAGSSPRGRDFAARWAEVVFTQGQDEASMVAFREDMHRRMAAVGRAPESCRILTGITPVWGETDAIARERAEYLNSLEHAEYRVAYASVAAGVDLATHATAEDVAKARGAHGSHGLTENLSKVAGGGSLAEAAKRSTETQALVGSAETIADAMAGLHAAGACDGFVVMPTTFPTSHEQFCRAVVPELQRRGVFRTEYAADTLRGNLFA